MNKIYLTLVLVKSKKIEELNNVDYNGLEDMVFRLGLS